MVSGLASRAARQVHADGDLDAQDGGRLHEPVERGVLERGLLPYDGEAAGALDTYLRTVEAAPTEDLSSRTDRRGQGKIRLLGVA